jgi:hypothetical protein
VRLGSVWAGVWPGKRVADRTGSGRIGCGHSRVWFAVYRAVPCCFKVAQGVRRNAPKGDGGESRPCRRRGPTAPGDWSPHDSLTGFPRVAGSKGLAPRGDDRRGEVGAGGVAVVLAPPPSAGTSESWVLWRARGSARARWLPVGVGLAATGCRGGDHGGAWLDAMGGGEHGARGRFAQAREGSRRVAGCVQGDQGRGALLPPLPATVHGFPATARPWRRGHPRRGGVRRRRRARIKGPALSPD